MTEIIRDTSQVVLSNADKQAFDQLLSDGVIKIDKKNKVTVHGLLMKGLSHGVDLNRGAIIELGLPPINDALLFYLREISDWEPNSIQNTLGD